MFNNSSERVPAGETVLNIPFDLSGVVFIKRAKNPMDFDIAVSSIVEIFAVESVTVVLWLEIPVELVLIDTGSTFFGVEKPCRINLVLSGTGLDAVVFFKSS